MPQQVRIIQKKDTSFDHFIRELMDAGKYRIDHEYFGIEDEDRAVFVRNKLHTAGKRHMKPPVGVKAYRRECYGCPNGGPSCRWHVVYAIYPMEEAIAYKRAQAQYGEQHKGNYA